MAIMSDTATTNLGRTVLQRLLEAGITPERARAHLKRGWVRVDDIKVTDAEYLAESPAQVELRPRPPYDA
jgi:hypothetical protein